MVYFQFLVAVAAGYFGRLPDASHLSILNYGSSVGPPGSSRRARRARKRARFFKPCLEGLEERVTPDIMSWNGSTTDGQWYTAANWTPGWVPRSIDDVYIADVTPNPDPSISISQTFNQAFANSVHVQNSGNLWVHAPLTVTGSLSIDASSKLYTDSSITANQVSNSGQLNSFGSTITATVTNATGGTLQTDTNPLSITGSLSSDGNVAIGGYVGQPSSLSVSRNYTQTSNGALTVYGSGNFSSSALNVTGTATLAGTLATGSGSPAANPTRNKTPTIISAASVTGMFSNNTVTWGKYTWTINYPAAATSVQLYVPQAGVNPANEQFLATPGVEGEGMLANFSSTAGSGLTASSYAVWIDWGDGDTTQAERMDGSSVQGYDIFGVHTFNAEGFYDGSITVTDTYSNVSWSAPLQFQVTPGGYAPSRLAAATGKAVMAAPAAPSALLPLLPANSGPAVPAGGNGALTVSGAVSAAPFLPGLAPPAATVPAADAAAVDEVLSHASADLNLWPAEAGLRALPLDAYFAGLPG
jgi:hypothetical protein